MKLRWILAFLLAASVAKAQKADLSNPRASFRTFHENLQPDNLNVGVASKVISSRSILSRAKRERLVQELMAYLTAKKVVVYLDSITDDPNYIDTVTNQPIYVVNELVSFSKQGSNWYFSKQTVNMISHLDAEDTLSLASDEPDQKDELSRRQLAQLQREEELKRIQKMSVDFSSPYATVSFFLENKEKDYAIASRVISKTDIPGLEDRIDIIEKLDRFFSGKGVIIDLDKVPEDPDYTDSTRVGKLTYELSYRFPQIYLEKQGNQWLLAKESAEKIPELYTTAFPFGSDRLLRYLPTEGQIEFLGLYVWQYVAILLLVLFTYLVFRMLNWIVSYLVTKVLFRFGYNEVAKTYVMPVVRPIGLLISFIMAETILPFLQLPLKVNGFVTVTVEILIPFFSTIAFYYAIDIVALYLEKLASKTENTFDDQLVPLIKKTLKTFVVIIGFIVVLKQMNVDIKLLLGTLSVGGLALALAAQDTIKNFFGSMMIFVDKPFQAGHWVVTSDGIDGTVEQVGFRSTRIRTFENSVITVPNGKLSDASINNYGMRAYRRFKTHITITYDTPPELVELFIEGLREIVKKHPHTRKDYYHVYMNNMGAHSLDILFYIFFITPDWGQELKYRHEVILSIMKLAQTLGVNFAFPTQTLHMETFPGQMPNSPTYGDPRVLKPKMEEFLNKELSEEK